METPVERAGRLVAASDAILICAGAGMGVDSGLPDFRGAAGFWEAYPPYQRLGLSFTSVANPQWFEDDPLLAWGFYGHRLQLYRDTRPHAGFAVLERWSRTRPLGAFVFTSNVDGQFQKGGFRPDQLFEVHGSIHHLQCLRSCGAPIFPADGHVVEVDTVTMRAVGVLPSCPRCGGMARPNILMFGDFHWDATRADAQDDQFSRWQKTLERSLDRRGAVRLAVIEMGAGNAIATVRRASERMARHWQTSLIRINPRESDGPPGTISIASGAVRALEEMNHLV